MTYLACCIWFICFCDIVKGLYLFSSCQPIRFEFLLLMSGNLAWEHLEHKNYFAMLSIFARLSNSKRNRDPGNCNSSGRVASWSLDKPLISNVLSWKEKVRAQFTTMKAMKVTDPKHFVDFKIACFFKLIKIPKNHIKNPELSSKSIAWSFFLQIHLKVFPELLW